MTPFVSDADFTLYVGDVREVLAGLPAESVHCVVTSPPYWGLRDYQTGSWDGGNTDCDHTEELRPSSYNVGFNERWGNAAGDKKQEERGRRPFKDVCGKCGARRVDQQLGLEPTPDEYVQNMVAVFREVRRVLRRDGTCWLNIGSSYANGMGGGLQGGNGQRADRTFTAEGMGKPVPPGFKPKDMIPIPWLLGLALQADGWYLRSDVIWAKPNPMPESVTDRPTKAHEYVFLLTKAPRYYFDSDAIREPHAVTRWRGNGEVAKTADVALDQRGDSRAWTPNVRDYNPAGRNKRSVWEIAEQDTLDPSLPPEKPRGPDGRRKTTVTGGDGSIQHRDGERWPAGGANRRSVWNIATEPYPDAHFATFPQALVEPCVLAGTSERGCCPVCGAPWERETELDPIYRARLVQRERPELLGGWLREKRVQAGIKQGDLAALFPSRTGGLTGCVSNWELDKNIPTAEQWAILKTALLLDDEKDALLEAWHEYERGLWGTTPDALTHGAPSAAPAMAKAPRTIGWRPTCDCTWPTTHPWHGQALSPVPCTVLDPFMGSGTTALVARRLGRNSIGIELNAEYARLCAERLKQLSLFAGST